MKILLISFLGLMVAGCSTIGETPQQFGKAGGLAYMEARAVLAEDNEQIQQIELCYLTLCEVLDNRATSRADNIKSITAVTAAMAKTHGLPPGVALKAQGFIARLYEKAHQKYGLGANGLDNAYRQLEEFRQGVEQAKDEFNKSTTNKVQTSLFLIPPEPPEVVPLN
tara:strand:+ start:243 stop:743 length:501 start_codon:yes stop_codon:yes gene_type:complete